MMSSRKINFAKVTYKALVCFTVSTALSSAYAEITFLEVTAASGMTYSGDTWGAAWGDFNGDGLPDLRVGNHNKVRPSIYLNKFGLFSDVGEEMLNWQLGDVHGATWVDFDNDGDLDLYETSGGSDDTPYSRNRFYLNNGGTLSFADRATQLNATHALGRDRTPLWLDWNSDGLLDVVVTSITHEIPSIAYTSLLQQMAGGGFQDATSASGIYLPSSVNQVQLANIYGGAKPELIADGLQFPYKVYSLSKDLVSGGEKYFDVRSTMAFQALSNVTDFSMADFNNDLQPDIFALRSVENWGDLSTGSDVALVTPTLLKVMLAKKSTPQQVGVQFKVQGAIHFELSEWIQSYSITYDQVHIGTTGWSPTNFQSFNLSSDDASVWGMPVYVPGMDKGVYIGYDKASGNWKVMLSAPDQGLFQFVLQSQNPITGLTALNFTPATSKSALVGSLQYGTGSGFREATAGSGLDKPESCVSVGAADFDNDMDIDLYMVCTGHVANLPNRLYENLGNGTFARIPLAGGAEGTILGKGETVAIADYDVDGYLDLFVGNGHCCAPFTADGPHQLFRNTGQGNHWIEIDLEGVLSNRDAIGARVVALAGGVSQLREQNGGVHRYTQNHARLHFGLAGNTTIGTLKITWPSGIVQTLNNLPADQVLHVHEPVNPKFYGQPQYSPGSDDGVYLWRDEATGAYRLRVSSTGQGVPYQVKVITSSPIMQINPVNLVQGELFVERSLGFSLQTSSGTTEAGVDFELPAEAKAMISIERNGVANPRHLHVGPSRRPLTPAGWIISSGMLPPRPSDTSAGHHGLFLGKGNIADTVEVRWRADAATHQDQIFIMTSEFMLGAGKYAFESDDIMRIEGEAVQATTTVGNWNVDGLKILLPSVVDMAIAYQRDGLLSSHRVNTNGAPLGMPNAYWLQ